jgi:hypothetical protein
MRKLGISILESLFYDLHLVQLASVEFNLENLWPILPFDGGEGDNEYAGRRHQYSNEEFYIGSRAARRIILGLSIDSKMTTIG